MPLFIMELETYLSMIYCSHMFFLIEQQESIIGHPN